MGQFYETIPEHLVEWVLQQQVFWVATAPLSANGHINVSPKGGPYFGIIDPTTFWYLDMTGSGCETIAHLRENGRITVSFNAFAGGPKIIRFWGHGRILERSTPPFDRFTAQHDVEVIPATRSIIVVDIHQVGSSCGFSVPFMEFKGHRDTLLNFFEKKKRNFEGGKESESMDRYWGWKNSWSIDGMPAMQAGLTSAEQHCIAPLEKMVGPLAPPAPYGPKSFNYQKYIRYRIASIKAVRFDILHMLIAVLVALVMGVIIGQYGPAVVAEQRTNLSRAIRQWSA